MSSAGAQGNDGANAPALSMLRVLGRRWFHLVIAVVVAGALGLIVSMMTTPTYQASARVVLGSDPEASGGVDLTRVVQTHAQIATSTQTIDQVVAAAQANNPEITASYVAGHIDATPAESAYSFTITATADTQQKAIDLVQLTIAAYKKVLTAGADAQELAALEKSRTDAITESRNAPDDQSWTNVITGLNQRIAELRLLQSTGDSDVRLVESPRAEGQIAPKPFVSVLIAALVGLFLAAAVIWIRYLRQPTVLDGRAAADAINAPLIVGGGNTTPSIDTIVSAMAAVLSPTVKVVALTPAGSGDLTPETVAAVATSWSDDQGVVLVMDASPNSEVRGVLERLPRATSGGLPSWAHEPTCLARSSGTGRGHVLYNRVSPSRASRPGGLAPILADRAPVVDLVLLLTPPLTDLPMTAASALQADAVVVITTPQTRSDELAAVPRDWPALAERVVGVIHADRTGFRPSSIVPETRGGIRPTIPGPADIDAGDPEATDRYARPKY
ncbi:MAG: lipopolysaccharide biosynthesis protein [Frankia sp.]|nr:lipopolysaccharide biosynthesis protein [Frankia sp.]